MIHKKDKDTVEAKNELAVALGKLRWAKKTEEEKSLHMKMMAVRRWREKREKEIEGEVGWKIKPNTT